MRKTQSVSRQRKEKEPRHPRFLIFDNPMASNETTPGLDGFGEARSLAGGSSGSVTVHIFGKELEKHKPYT